MNVKVAAILVTIILVLCVPEGDAFTAGAGGAPRMNGKREQVRTLKLSSV